ncbi:MAG: hypothetical protein KatS3mg078_0693 [Deltaproteobacteria bacterium]|nr:MAG: hypothetical protein KatS3mg078_0693 [Deltaproteobacteria bacterium]
MLFLLLFSLWLALGSFGCTKKETKEVESRYLSLEKEITLRGKIKTIAVMPTFFDIREAGKSRRFVEVEPWQRKKLTLEIREILSSKGYITPEFSQSIALDLEESKKVFTGELVHLDLDELMEDFKAICYVILANEYKKALEEGLRLDSFSVFPKRRYTLSPTVLRVVGLSRADAVLFTGVWGYVEQKGTMVLKTLVNSLSVFLGIPIILPYSSLLQFAVAVFDSKNGDVLWFNYGHSGFEVLLHEIPKRP